MPRTDSAYALDFVSFNLGPHALDAFGVRRKGRE